VRIYHDTHSTRHGIHTVEHLIFQCNRLTNEGEILKNSLFEAGNWPTSKTELNNMNLKQFIRYINSTEESSNAEQKELENRI
jgi:hypothetical protein